MAKDFIGYQALTDSALRGVVRDALRRIEKSGLIGAHHFYLTFKTHAEGVDIPAWIPPSDLAGFERIYYTDEVDLFLQLFHGISAEDRRPDDHQDVPKTSTAGS